jgi:hypothetical protein
MSAGAFFEKLAPWLSAGVSFVPGAGPVIAAGITAIAKTHNVTLPASVDPTVESIGNAVAAMTGNSDAMLALKKQDQEYASQMQAAGFKQVDDVIALGNEDRASARAMHAAVPKDYTPEILAGTITVGFFTTLWVVFVHGVNPETHDLAMVMVGLLGSAFGAVVAFYFGSSSGSEAKTKIIGDIAKEP